MYFMISLQWEANGGGSKNVEVEAPTSDLALIKAVMYVGRTASLPNEPLLHQLHVGVPYDAPADDTDWDEEDKFERAHNPSGQGPAS